MPKKICKIKLRWLTDNFPEILYQVENKRLLGHEWPITIDIDRDTSIQLEKHEFKTARAAYEYYENE